MKLFKNIIPVFLFALVLTVVSTGRAQAASDTGHSHPICGSVCDCGESHSAVTWTALPQSAAKLSDGYYYLDSSRTVSSTTAITITGPVTLCLNNNNLTQTSSSHCLRVTGSGSLTLCDCGGSGTISNAYDVGGQGCIGLYDSSSMTVYGGTVNGQAFSGIMCSTTGNLTVNGGTITGRTEGIDLYNVGDFTMTAGNATSTAGSAVNAEYGTFGSISVSGGLLEGVTAGLRLSQNKSVGPVRISGGTFNGKGPVPNTTTYSADYYGLSFASLNIPACQVYITGGNFTGARGGVYNYSSEVGITISDGTFGDASKHGLQMSAGHQYIYGGQIYGIKTGGVSTTNIYDGNVLYVTLSSGSTSTSSTLNVYGGTIGTVLGETASWAVNCSLVGASQSINISGGTITGTKYAIRTNSTDSVSVSGGNLSGSTADIYITGASSTYQGAYLSLDGYTGTPLSVAIPSKSTVGQYVAKNVARADLITIVTSPYSAAYDSTNSAVKINGPHSHTYGSWIQEVPATCTATGTLGYQDCTVCYLHFDADGTELTDLTIPVNGNNHTSATVSNGQDATCTEDGITSGVYCNACQTWLTEPTMISALGHDYADGICTRCQETDPDFVKGDYNGDKIVTNEDVVKLLWHILFPEEYPFDIVPDLNGDAQLTNEDVIKLLWYALFPEQYPL